MAAVVALASRVAPTDAVVLITGESGVGKDLLAQAIHFASHRSDSKFMAVNCAAVPESLLESELFGHEKGAFTGASAMRKGKFEQADGGTLFLDEIGEMTLSAQSKILRVLENRTIERIGGSESIPVDIRILAATNRDLRQCVRDGTFRQDLYYRLNEVNINVPPLRERKEDIPVLVDRFIELYNQQYSKDVKRVSDAALQFLHKHSWPGNVRELHHVIKCAMLMLDGDTIWLEHIPLSVRLESSEAESPEETTTRADDLMGIMSLDEVEKRHILRILEYTRWNKSQAAQILKTSRPTLDRKIQKYGLSAHNARHR